MEEEGKKLAESYPVAVADGSQSFPSQMEETPYSSRSNRSVRRWISPSLFILTLLTTLISGARLEGVDPLRNPALLFRGAPFAFSLMTILFVHEMGHYLTSKHYGVQTTPPFFIPGPWFPSGIGTFGAFIRMRSPILQKHALLAIGAAGPIAGFVVALGATVAGLLMSTVAASDSIPHNTWVLGNALLFSALTHLLLQPPAGYDIILHPVALAGWFGFFVTSLNLLPIGQLDGGHIAYALLGKRQREISIGIVLILVVLGFYGWPGWYVWAFLTTMLGVRHPPTIDEDIALNLSYKIMGWGSLVLFILTFMPIPF